MYGKLMSISDEMMWRYYELLSDVQMADIETMKRESHPMAAKKDLARRIVTDFHSADAATLAEEDWAKQFQKGETPGEVEEVSVRLTEVAAKEDNGVRADRLLVQVGLAASAAEATRKIKEKAVRVNGELLVGNLIPLAPGPTIDQPVTIQLGRKMKKVTIRS
jgi:tyrosyl-tRNA synthetase